MAYATPLVNTLASPESGDTTRTLSAISSVGQSFIADSAGIGDVELELAKTGTTTGSLVITIETNNGGVPGTVVDTIATLPETSIPSTETLFDFYNIALTTPLTPTTEYWLDVTKSGSVSSETFATTRGNASIATSPTSYYRGSGSAVTNSSMAVCISDDNSCDATNVALAADSFNEAPVSSPTNTPEPASLALIGSGLIGIGFARRLKSSRKPASIC